MQFFAHFSRFCALKGGRMRKNIAIFASGNGTNAENLIRFFQNSPVADVKLILCNRSKAYVMERAERLHVPCRYFPKEEWTDGRLILAVLQEYDIDFIALAGFLAFVPSVILQAYPDRIVNIHPSLLPKFAGKGMYGLKVHESVLSAHELESGISIHYVNEQYDEGEIIAQYRCSVLPDDTPAALAARVHALEYEFYPKVIEQLLV